MLSPTALSAQSFCTLLELQEAARNGQAASFDLRLVTPEYASPFKFTGKIYGVTVDVSGDLIRDTEAEMRLVMARQ